MRRTRVPATAQIAAQELELDCLRDALGGMAAVLIGAALLLEDARPPVRRSSAWSAALPSWQSPTASGSS
jgi:hypothetical protein